MAIDLQDATLLLDRANLHLKEFKQKSQRLWSYRNEEIEAGRARHKLVLRRGLIPMLKPIVGDVANNLRHSLDQAAAAAAKVTLGEEAAESIRSTISFPFPNSDGSIEPKLESCDKYWNSDFRHSFMKVWERHESFEYYFRVVRIISNNSKHWILEVVKPEALAANLHPREGNPSPVAIPKGHFESKDEFVWEAPPAIGCDFLLKLQFNDIQPRPERNPMPPNPDSVFGCTARFVSDIISEFEQVISP